VQVAVKLDRPCRPAKVDHDEPGRRQGSVPRQPRAIQAYANRAVYRIEKWFDDGDVKGADPIDSRKGFAAMIEAIAGNGCRTIIVETGNRFARDLIVQETGYQRPKSEGITLIAADSLDCFTDETPTAVINRQILGGVAQFDKSMSVAKLRGPRDKKRAKFGKCEGRKSMLERNPYIVQAAKRLAGEKRRSLREIAAELDVQGFVAKSGKAFAADVVGNASGPVGPTSNGE
jgi:DNA invertase Pin-like site-specific DNA recombinase